MLPSSWNLSRPGQGYLQAKPAELERPYYTHSRRATRPVLVARASSGEPLREGTICSQKLPIEATKSAKASENLPGRTWCSRGSRAARPR